jgi:DNA mismatch repair protein MutS
METSKMTTTTADSSENIIDLYLKLTKEYKTQYGEQTVLLLMVGSFYEIYGIYDTQLNEISNATPITEVCQICSLNIAEKKIMCDGKKVHMAGFRDYSLEKYLPKLTESGYTTIVYNQEKNGKEIIRKLDAVYSPGTFISYDTDSSPQITNHIMCIWFELSKPNPTTQHRRLVYGVSVINIFTGESFLFENDCPFHMNPTTFDDLERCISIFAPSEIIFISPFLNGDNQKIIQYCGIKTNMIHYVDSNCITDMKTQNCLKQKYISHILSTFFSEDIESSHYEFREYAVATQSLCYLLNFVREHNPNLVRKLHIPKFNNSSCRTILANHTLIQLNIIRDSVGRQCGQLSSVLSFLNKSVTPMGKRLFQYQLTNPTFDEKWLQTEYDMIANTISADASSDSKFILNIRHHLQGIKDLEKNCRQIVLRKLYPSSLYHFYKSVELIRQINRETTATNKCEAICDYLLSKPNANIVIENTCCQILDFINRQLHIETCKNITSTQTFTENIIKTGISQELDDCILQIKRSTNGVIGIRDYLTGLLKREMKMKEGDEYIKIHETEKSGKSLQITQKRATLLKSAIAYEKTHQTSHVEICGYVVILEDIKFSKASGSSEEIHSPLIKELNATILVLEDKLNRFIAAVYDSILSTIETNYFKDIENLCMYISKLDVLQSKSYIANKYNYCSPQLVCGDDADTPSFVSFKSIRHVLIEHINRNEIYVTNDLEIGRDITGLLLFGTNAVGKTSFIRAIGISIIMAQSGMYVPCSEFKYKPYRAIFSRILSNDNLFKGLSTFAVEMSELRVILKNADKNSLILGDELASGTETESALSIFAAALIDLNQKKCSYLFATHFHEITEFEEIKHLHKLMLKHLSVKYDREKDCLIYDRKLKDGSGERIYGLEVCLSLALPKTTMDTAFEIRNKYFSKTKGELSYKPAHYNAKKIRGICEICKSEIATEVHHLNPQREANEKGFIDSFHKNHIANLAAICEKCHSELHHGEQTQLIRKKTTKGIVLCEIDK